MGSLLTMTPMGCNDPRLGRGRADVGLKDGIDLAKDAVGEDEADAAAAARLKTG